MTMRPTRPMPSSTGLATSRCPPIRPSNDRLCWTTPEAWLATPNWVDLTTAAAQPWPAAGSNQPARHALLHSEMKSSTPSTRPAKQWWNPSPAHMPTFSPQSHTVPTPHIPPIFSAFFSAVCGSPCLCPPASAGAVALLTPSATTALRVHKREVLRGRGITLQRAAARICREAGPESQPTPGSPTSTSTSSSATMTGRLKPSRTGWGPICLWHNIGLFITRAGQHRRHAGTFRGAALHTARRSKERTHPELLAARPCKLVVLGIEVGGRWSQEAANFVRIVARSKVARPQPFYRQPSKPPSPPGGAQCQPTLCRHPPQGRTVSPSHCPCQLSRCPHKLGFSTSGDRPV